MDLGSNKHHWLVFGVAGWTCFFCLQAALNWTRQNRPQYLFYVRYGNPRPSRHQQEAKIQQLRGNFDLTALRETLQCEKPVARSSLKDLDFTWVGQKRELKALAQLLQSCKVFSVDIEAHSVFAYQMMPCLLQVAVGGRCFVVDLLALHDCISILKAPFEDANVLKIMHGCHGDLQWLQQLDIYPVNVLDTCALAEEAVRVSRVKKPGLGSLLSQLCGIESNKSLAIGDWRKRPLSEEMLFYGVSDVNYLQYIAMTLVEFSFEEMKAQAAPVGDSSAATSKAAEASASAQKTQEPDQVLHLEGGKEEGPSASEQPAQGLPGSLMGTGGHGELPSEPAAAVASASVSALPSRLDRNPVDHEEEALDGGTPSTHAERAESLEVTTGPLDELQHPFSPPAVLSKKNLHRQNSRRSNQAADTTDCSRHEVSDCVESSSSAACNTGAHEAADLVDEHIDSATSQKTDLQDHELHLQQNSTTSSLAATTGECSQGKLMGGLDEAASMSDGIILAQQSSMSVTVITSATAAVTGVHTDASETTLGHVDSDAVAGASDLDADDAPGEHAPLEGALDLDATAPVATSGVAGTAGKTKRGGKKERKKNENKALEEGPAGGGAQPMDVARVWCTCCERTLIMHREATVADVANASMVRLVNREVEYRSKAVLHPSKRQGGHQSPTDPVMFRIVGVLCYWRTTVAHRVDISPVMILPDSLVNYFLKHRPRGTLGVVRCMLRWVTSHRQKHAERFLREAQAAEAQARGEEVATGASGSGKSNGKRWAAEDRNPFAWYLDNWSPSCATLLGAPWLSWLLYCAYTGRVSQLPVQVERMIAKQEVKHQPRPAAITAASSSKPSRNNTTSGPKAIDIGSNASQAAQTTTDAGTDASKGGTQKMTRDRIISKFSKKKPAYSSCRMLSQDGSFLAACDLKKLVWYVKKELGQWEPELGPGSTQPTIRLTFQHKTTTDQASGNDFYNEVKANECVGCGEAGHYLKYKIVPDCYRKHFPVNMKSHRSHDIVLLCIDCHERAHTSAEALKRYLAAVNNIPLQPGSSPIRSDPFLPTPPPEECCSSREDDADAELDADADAVSDVAGDCNESILEAAVAAASASADAATPNDTTTPRTRTAPAVPEVLSSTSASPSLMEVAATSVSTAAATAAASDCSRENAGSMTARVVGVCGAEPSSNVAGAEGAAGDGITGSLRLGGVVEEAVDAVSEHMPSLAHVRRVALTLERHPNVPTERRLELEAVVARYVHGPAAAIDRGLGPGDIEAALLAGLAKTKRNQTISRLIQAGRPPPLGYVLSQQEGRVSVVSAPHHQGGHMWHGRKVVEKIVATYGLTGLQELQVEFRKRFVDAVKPENLPGSWKIHHEAPREFGMHSIFSEHPFDETASSDSRPPQVFAAVRPQNTTQQLSSEAPEA